MNDLENTQLALGRCSLEQLECISHALVGAIGALQALERKGVVGTVDLSVDDEAASVVFSIEAGK